MAGGDRSGRIVRRGRSSRVAARTAGPTPTAAGTTPQRRIPTYELLADANLIRLEAHADWILSEIGVEFRGDDEALELLRAAGAQVDGVRVRFEPGLARQLCSTAPGRFAMWGRDGRRIEIGGDHVLFTPTYGPPFVTDLGRSHDWYRPHPAGAARLADDLRELSDHHGSPLGCADVRDRRVVAMDADRCGMLHRLLEGLAIDDNELGSSAFNEAGPGGNFLATAHTMANFETANFEAALCDTRSFEQWSEEGSLDMAQRANRQWKQTLADYEPPPPLDPAVNRELQAFVTERKAAVTDAWY